MRILPLPSIEIIGKIGKSIFQNLPQIGHILDMIVAHILELDSERDRSSFGPYFSITYKKFLTKLLPYIKTYFTTIHIKIL